MQRYQRQIILKEVGVEGQQKLKEAKVLVIGAGGLGSPVMFYLTAAGIGNIGIADFDNVSVHNLQRQILFNETHINQNKAQTAVNQLILLNPDVHFQIYDEGLHLQNFRDIIPLYDIVVDGSDNFSTKYLVNDACFVYKKTLVYGAIHQWEGQFSVFNYPVGEKRSANLRDLYPKPPAPEKSPSCSNAGIIGTIAGVIGSLIANETIKILLNLEKQVLFNQFIHFNLLNYQFVKIKFDKNPSNPLHENWNFDAYDYEFLCEKSVFPSEMNLTIEQFEQIKKANKPFLLIDVREEYEHALENLGGLNVPLSQIHEVILDKHKPVIFYCSSGERSKFAAIYWKKKGFNAYNLIRSMNDNPK